MFVLESIKKQTFLISLSFAPSDFFIISHFTFHIPQSLMINDDVPCHARGGYNHAVSCEVHVTPCIRCLDFCV